MADSTGTKLIKSSLLVSSFVALNALTSLAFQMLLAARFGVGPAMTAFVAASAVPMFFLAVIIGSQRGAFVPLLAEAEKLGRKTDRTGSHLVNLVAIGSAIVTIAAIILSPAIVSVAAPGLSLPVSAQTVLLLRLMLPSFCFSSVAYTLASRYQAKETFLLPAMIPFVIQAVNLLLVAIFRGVGINMAAASYSVGALLSAVMVFIPVLTKGEYKLSISLGDPAIRRALAAMGILVISSMFYAAYPVMERRVASGLSEAAISYIGYSGKLSAMLASVLATGVAASVLPCFSGYIVKNDSEGLRRIATASLNTIIAVTIPVLVLLAILREPVVRVLFQRGAFDTAATSAVAGALLFYLPSALGFCITVVAGNVLYAFRDIKLMSAIGIVSVIAYFAYCPVLANRFGYIGVATGTSIFALGSAAAQCIAACSRRHAVDSRLTGLVVLKTCASAAIAGLTTFSLVGPSPGLGKAVAGGLAGLGVYLLLATCVFRVSEISYLLARIPPAFETWRQV